MILSFINIRKVPRKMLKTEGEVLGFQHLPRDLANVNALGFQHLARLLINGNSCLIPIMKTRALMYSYPQI